MSHGSDSGLTPPGPPVEPVPPAAPADAAPPAGAGGRLPPTPYRVPAPVPGPPPPGGQLGDKALGWTGLGLVVPFCVPFLPAVGAVLAATALARRRFRPRGVAALTLVLGLGATALQVAVLPSLWERVVERIDEVAADPDGDASTVLPTELEDGDCFDDPVLRGITGAGEVEEAEEVEILPCDEPHDFEVYATIRLEGDDYPGSAVIDRRGGRCLSLFEEFVGIPYVESRYEVFQYFPTQRSWDWADDRTITCVIGHARQAKVEGSLEGARR